MKREIKKNRYIGYYNQLYQYHCEGDKPSVIVFHGNISFCKNDKDNRQGKPVRVWSDGTLEYWENNYKFVKRVYP